MTLAVTIHSNAAEFLERARGPLEEREDENNFVLGVALRIASGGRPGDERAVLTSLSRDGVFAGAAVATPERELAHTELESDAAQALCRELDARGISFPGSLGPRPDAERFAEAWAGSTGVVARVVMEKRLHRLERVEAVPEVPGSLRAAGAPDLELLREWAPAFARDARLPHAETSGGSADQHVGDGRLFVWERDGAPVSMAAWSRPTRRSASVGMVYTPPEARGHGYASAITAALSQHLLDQGREFLVLFTDLANPTSNRIYARIGFRPVRDFRLYGY